MIRRAFRRDSRRENPELASKSPFFCYRHRLGVKLEEHRRLQPHPPRRAMPPHPDFLD